ncbi:MAG: hypothetical protein OQK04_07525 [Kangiellaceae bacterium]|nr:hypothetical protein [Kangiellaceae bacterium]MCW8998549.1 hypothetical protein [Kangiellaceae bacterium]
MDVNDQIKLELETIQSEIIRYDSNGFSIKGWGVAAWSSAIVYLFVNADKIDKVKIVEDYQWVMLVVPLLICLFLMIYEGVYRIYQNRFIRRSKEIELFLRKDDLGRYKYSVNKTATTQLKKEICRLLLMPQYWLLYAFQILISIIVIALNLI